MKLNFWLAACLAVFFCFGCAPVVGEKVEYAKACDRGNDKKTLEVKGFLDDAGGLFCSNTSGRMECGFKFKKDLAQKERGFSADIATGGGANAMDEVKSGYRKSDLVVRDDNGKKVDLGKEVTVTGLLTSFEDKTSPEGGGCYMKVYKIEQ